MLVEKLCTIRVLLVMIAALLTTFAPTPATLATLLTNNSLFRLFVVLLLLFYALPTNWDVKYAA